MRTRKRKCIVMDQPNELGCTVVDVAVVIVACVVLVIVVFVAAPKMIAVAIAQPRGFWDVSAKWRLAVKKQYATDITTFLFRKIQHNIPSVFNVSMSAITRCTHEK